jgi:hypothetical protein
MVGKSKKPECICHPWPTSTKWSMVWQGYYHTLDKYSAFGLGILCVMTMFHVCFYLIIVCPC